MKLLPKKREQLPGYPRAKSFFSPNRELLQILASLGIAAGTAAAGPASTAPAPTEAKAVVKIPLGKMDAMIQALCSRLGDNDYKVRRKSSLKLIQIGKGEFSTTKEKAEAKKLVLAAVAKLDKHKDPEVRCRASLVKKALVVKKVVRRTPIRTGGAMVAPIRVQAR